MSLYISFELIIYEVDFINTVSYSLIIQIQPYYYEIKVIYCYLTHLIYENYQSYSKLNFLDLYFLEYG